MTETSKERAEKARQDRIALNRRDAKFVVRYLFEKLARRDQERAQGKS